jgi:AcrR family transcriptional regulator
MTTRSDWLIGPDRQTVATDRIYTAAAALIARHGYDAFTIAALAAKVHCSPATVYRYVGGKAAIRNAVTLRLSTRVVDSVRAAIDGLTGSERIETAVVVALERMRSEPLSKLMGDSIRGARDEQWINNSPAVLTLAQEMIGLDIPDPTAARWLIHVVLALWCWPVTDPEVELDMIRRFLAPPFAQRTTEAKGNAIRTHSAVAAAHVVI